MESDDILFDSADWLEDEKVLQKIDEDLDFSLAYSLQEEWNDEASQAAVKHLLFSVPSTSSTSPENPKSLIDPQWDLVDPNPDIQAMFLQFNTRFFYGRLSGIEVKWSPRMTRCAGMCCYEGRGGLCSVRLSEPLLKLRPRIDLVETLLHEMIHAYLFVTNNNKDRSAHGPEFHSHMYRINKETGTNISVYHSFHDEVDFYLTHWWKCDGPCRFRRPFYGLVKRAMNRAPSAQDPWWAQHQSTCGGTFQKIKEPESYKAKAQKRKLPNEMKNHKQSPGIKDFFNASSSSSIPSKTKKPKDDSPYKSVFGKENIVSVHNGITESSDKPFEEKKPQPKPFSGKGFTLGSTSNDVPQTFLSKIRKELDFSHLKPASQNSSKILSKKNPINLRTEELVKPKMKEKKSATTPISSVSKHDKSKLTQSSIKKFISPPKSSSLGSQKAGPSISDLKRSKSPILAIDLTDMERNQLQPESTNTVTVQCPVCSISWPERDINSHLDQCLLRS